MSETVFRETQVQRRDAANAYARLDDLAFARLNRRFQRKVRLVDFILAWRDGEQCRDIADRFDLRDVGYVSALRRRLRLPPRREFAKGGGR
ncbi:MAG: hypothetical protein NBV67_00305 [Tagaea sp.]|nr:hypothetical protein [Tagaea sp.]